MLLKSNVTKIIIEKLHSALWILSSGGQWPLWCCYIYNRGACVFLNNWTPIACALETGCMVEMKVGINCRYENNCPE